MGPAKPIQMMLTTCKKEEGLESVFDTSGLLILFLAKFACGAIFWRWKENSLWKTHRPVSGNSNVVVEN